MISKISSCFGKPMTFFRRCCQEATCLSWQCLSWQWDNRPIQARNHTRKHQHKQTSQVSTRMPQDKMHLFKLYTIKQFMSPLQPHQIKHRLDHTAGITIHNYQAYVGSLRMIMGHPVQHFTWRLFVNLSIQKECRNSFELQLQNPFKRNHIGTRRSRLETAG